MCIFKGQENKQGDAFQAELCFALMEVAHTSVQAIEQCFFDVTQ